MKLSNTLTHHLEDFKPLKPGIVSVYSCGPTVYEHVHIGNLRYFIVVDTLNRTLQADGLRVYHTMNITDIDDKTINASQERFSEDASEVVLRELTSIYEYSFLSDMAEVGNDLTKYNFIKATDSIESIQELIRDLITSGVAYIADDGIYFSIEAYKKKGRKYGQLSKVDSDSTSQARITNDEYDKKSVHDFALWKLQKDNEPAWPFEINHKDYLGRPGWHIECSAMSQASLGLPFDIHTGGVDLIFPHHENEIAQSTADSKSAVYANCFVHSEHLLIDRRKMSKSLGNTFTLEDVKLHNFESIVLRLLVLQSHYRTQANFTWELMKAAATRLQGLYNLANLRWQPNSTATSSNELITKIEKDTKTAMFNDLDTPTVLALISELQNKLEVTGLAKKDLAKFNDLLNLIDDLLGLDLLAQSDITEDEKKLLGERAKARAKKDWAASDQLRKRLELANVGIRDTDYGQIWYRLS